MRQRRMNSTFTWLALICLHQLLVQGAEGSVGQNIQYPQVRVLLMPVCKFSRIVAPTPSRFPQHKGLFLRSASFAGIVCIVPGELRANNFTFSTRDASGTVHIAFAGLLSLPRTPVGIVCIVPAQLWALFHFSTQQLDLYTFVIGFCFQGYYPFQESPARIPPKVRKPPYLQTQVVKTCSWCFHRQFEKTIACAR